MTAIATSEGDGCLPPAPRDMDQYLESIALDSGAANGPAMPIKIDPVRILYRGIIHEIQAAERAAAAAGRAAFTPFSVEFLMPTVYVPEVVKMLEGQAQLLTCRCFADHGRSMTASIIHTPVEKLEDHTKITFSLAWGGVDPAIQKLLE